MSLRFFVSLVLVLALAQLGCDNSRAADHSSASSQTAPGNDQGAAAQQKGPKEIPAGTKTNLADGQYVVFFHDKGLLDFAFDAAHIGNTHDAMEAMADTRAFHVTGPASLEVKESEMKSRWPKVFVKILDGESAGETGWVVVSELKDLPQPPKQPWLAP